MGQPQAVRVESLEDRSSHRSLVARVLRIDPGEWAGVLDAYHAGIAADATIDVRLALLGTLMAARFPDAAPLSGELAKAPCPACGANRVHRRYHRNARGATGAPSAYTYGVCDACGHAVLLEGAIDSVVYASPAYYQSQGSDGVGYPAYEEERAYREAKGERLIRWALAHSAETPRTLLEVGSGFGFTRRGAERAGLRTDGVDLNPAAAAGARRLYGMTTFVGTLADALAAGAFPEGAYDVVVYDFVLEHLADPAGELVLASRLLSPSGSLVIRVPGIEAVELEPFGALYRSFRSDHLHLFSRASLQLTLDGAGLALAAYDTGCGADLLREVLAEPELRAAYAAGRGPDITACATRRDHARSARRDS